MKNVNINAVSIATATGLTELAAALVRKGVLSPEEAAVPFEVAAQLLEEKNKDATTDLNLEAAGICRQMADSVGNEKPE